GNSGLAPVAANLTSGSGISISNGAGSISISNTGFINGGNSFGTTATIGTNDNNKLEFEVNGLGRMWIDVNGRLLVGYYTGDDELDVWGTIDSEYGYQYNDAAPTGQYLRGNGTAFVASTIQASDLPTISSAGGWTDDGS
ncbi:MAG: hypothetical protein QME52_14145, partial [Bacteroidota bacterium]|nr:hypothetical protein [Bacteroidota bacterium]